MRLHAQYNFAKEYYKRGSLYNNQMAIFVSAVFILKENEYLLSDCYIYC